VDFNGAVAVEAGAAYWLVLEETPQAAGYVALAWCYKMSASPFFVGQGSYGTHESRSLLLSTQTGSTIASPAPISPSPAPSPAASPLPKGDKKLTVKLSFAGSLPTGRELAILKSNLAEKMSAEMFKGRIAASEIAIEIAAGRRRLLAFTVSVRSA